MIGFGFWSVWQALSVINKAFLLLICGVSVYSLAFSLHSLFVVRSLKAEQQISNTRLGTVCRRLSNLRQLHLLALYLFGFCIMVQIPDIFHTVTLSYDIPSLTVIRTLAFLCYFDATIFLVFALIHSVQWFVSARVNSLQGRN